MKHYIPGQTIGSVTFLRETLQGSNQRRMGVFLCPFCNKEFTSGISEAKARNLKSCGCKRGTHNLTQTSLYHVWVSMKARCLNSKHVMYKYYGGRGITVSDEFLTFINWHGYVVSLPNFEQRDAFKLTLDRVDNNKGYERGNLKWATWVEQSQNKRKQSKNHEQQTSS